MSFRAAILDRDGVINHDSDAYIKSPAEWQPIAGSLEAIARLKAAGLSVLVATNQSGLAHGLFDEPTLQAMHDKMRRLVEQAGGAIDDIAFCPHRAADDCLCRKPRPGMLDRLRQRWQLAAGECFMVGDKVTDMQAARAAGVAGYGVRSGYPIAPGHPVWLDTLIFPDLATLVEYLGF